MIILLVFNLIFLPVCTNGKSVIAHFNMAGVIGNVTFHQEAADENVTVTANLNTLWIEDELVNATWAIHTFPVDYGKRPLCHQNDIGNSDQDMTNTIGNLILPAVDTQWTTPNLTLWGPKTIWDKTLVIQIGGLTACATLLSGDPVRTMEAIFTGPAAGRVLFRQLVSSPSDSTLILVDLFHVDNGNPSDHKWQILATEVLDNRGNQQRCDQLHVLYDVGVRKEADCNSDAHSACRMGDLTQKHGPVSVGRTRSQLTRRRFIDQNLWLPEVSARRLFLVLFDKEFQDSIQACAPMVEVKPRGVTALLGSRGSVDIEQHSSLDLTYVFVRVEGDADALAGHSFPVSPRITADDELCESVGGPFNPYKIEEGPDIGNGTYDMFAIGDFSGKYGRIEGEFADPYLSLFGTNSIIGRSVVLYVEDGQRRLCGTFESKRPIITAVATLVHPVVGKVVFQQLVDEPASETTVLIEGLQYADNHLNDTHLHKWNVFTVPVGRDFLNWTKRCESAGSTYNPSTVGKLPSSQMNCGGDPLRCAIGDLSRKAGLLSIAGSRKTLTTTRRYHVDVMLPLSGPNSIIGRTLAVMDDHAPAFRGNRMACSVILRSIPLHAIVNNWYSAEQPIPVSGQLDVAQDTIYSSSRLLVDIRGLQSLATTYSINKAPVPLELDFPCGADTIQDVYDPFHASGLRGNVQAGAKYAVGDLSGKFGTLNGKKDFRGEFISANLPLHGVNSIIGRSIVISKQERNGRWICGTIDLDVPEGAEKIHGLASFHDPNGFAYGYIRLTQLVLKDGGQSDTWIEVNLRYPGVNNKNMSSGHEWAIFVNPVGHDATVKPHNDRCIAAGFKWNPFLIVDSIENYVKECTIWTPLRCLMGDVSKRQTPLDIGGPSKILADSNLPLAGEHSVLRRSIVIYDKNRSDKRFACANIYPEKYAINVVTIKNPRYFSSATFMDQAREVLAIPAWMMFAEAKKTRLVLEGRCVQVTVHFRGPDVEILQHIFTNVLATGWIERYSRDPLKIGGGANKKARFGYRRCRTEFNGGIQRTPLLTSLLVTIGVCLLLLS